jgi:hypothetical protein
MEFPSTQFRCLKQQAEKRNEVKNDSAAEQPSRLPAVLASPARLGCVTSNDGKTFALRRVA